MRLESGQWSFDVPQGSVTLPFRTSFAMFCQRLAWKEMEYQAVRSLRLDLASGNDCYIANWKMAHRNSWLTYYVNWLTTVMLVDHRVCYQNMAGNSPLIHEFPFKMPIWMECSIAMFDCRSVIYWYCCTNMWMLPTCRNPLGWWEDTSLMLQLLWDIHLDSQGHKGWINMAMGHSHTGYPRCSMLLDHLVRLVVIVRYWIGL